MNKTENKKPTVVFGLTSYDVGTIKLKNNIGIAVVVPSGGGINDVLADIIKKKSPKSNVMGDVMRKLSVEEVRDELWTLGSDFRKKFGRTPVEWRQTTIEMENAFHRMDQKRDGYFTYHLTPSKYRDAITTTLSKEEITCAKYAKLLYKKDILILDDSISRANTIKKRLRYC